ncbi:MAG: hypothetical protein KH347_03335 [Acetobacter sp.]|nr:hypothetical protein [Acetobacter sp.]
MSLIIVAKNDKRMEDAATKLTVGMYLNKLMKQVDGVPKRHRDEVADVYMADHPMEFSEKNKAKAVEEVENLQEFYGKEAKSASLKTKMQAAFGYRGSEVARAVALGAAAVVCGVMAKHGGIDMMAAPTLVLAAGASCTVANAQAMPEATDKEKSDVKKYADAKRALFALKKMKKALAPESTYKKEVQALYASGLGNPGGMITALNLKQKGGR